MSKERIILFSLMMLTVTAISNNTISNFNYNNNSDINNPIELELDNYATNLYNKLNHQDLNYEAFYIALKGHFQLMNDHKLENDQFLTIIDMSLSANENRFFLIDLKNEKLIKKSKVAHGRNSGGEYAKSFSNIEGSYKTSLGFYKTAETYFGKHGLSLKLDGLESSNSNARKRAIVMHAADYVSDDFINKNGRLGRSLGCPSLPKKGYDDIIHTIKNGSTLFIYFPHEQYLSGSELVKVKIKTIFKKFDS